jgi:mono/diheme cytochrome c family protein
MRMPPSLSSVASVCVLLGGALLVTLAISSVGAEEPIGDGQELFERLCASCHGPEGMGDGAAGKALAMPPSNLTRLGNQGVFPFEDVAAAIDGRARHGQGSSHMPIWGDIFAREFRADTGPDLLVQKRIHELTRYVETLQE